MLRLSLGVKILSSLNLQVSQCICTSFQKSRKYSKNFRRYTEEDICNILIKSLDSYKDVQFEPYRLKNFTLGSSFTKANVKIEQIIKDLTGKLLDPYLVDDNTDTYSDLVDFKSIFRNGFDSLNQNIAEGKTDNVDINFAIQAIKTSFLQDKDFHELCLQKLFTNDDDEDDEVNEELKVTVLLANHLLSRLTMPRLSTSARFGTHFFVANDYRSKDFYRRCPCGMCGEKIPYQNSGLGSELLWYGYPDIIVYSLGGKCNIVRPQQKDREDLLAEEDIYFEAEFDEKQLIEVKKHKDLLRYPRNISQFVAQCITFSYYQKHFQLKHKKSSLPVSFIPTIALSGTHFDIYMYDSDNDILLRNKGSPIPLWSRKRYPEAKLNMSSVLQIWMILNHLSLSPSLPEEKIKLMKGSCDFFPVLSSKRVDLIAATMTMKKRFTPWEYEEINSLPFPKGKLISGPLDKKK
ncbi:uncharacterized protein LOC134691045 isoform X1 [Mytilus trossulus]|uniref:uncharacterized protein LOC134691045 isoform X1 n=1 Tax=Mytilus trossulus TaxID=6551 RepID=UPI0030050BB0